MSLTITPVPARTDDPAAPAAGTARLVRRAGIAVAAGAAVWGTTMFLVSPQATDPTGITLGDVGALPFQASLFVLVTAQLRTMATGVSRLARGLLRVEYVLLALATLWTVLHAAVPAFRDDLWLAVLDVFWPLSMLGMFVIGVKIAFAGRWRGAARVWPSVAESWAVVSVPAMVVFGETAGQYVGASHLFVGYGVLGLILALRPHLTGAR
ncbi:hypothetical protein [Spirilliplanes yamanashiensis]|uniref:Uncharacterized protein n=1 Tax=Spirilliplanes yamanashiensis TaxID=42233 RepID=A0A8J4DLH1_9ACTN|nr:hypothetical protein [Spirilliplanes yamanashiensis]MDP9818928.1 hypothetical protein [Spirilliplanes yamanashiensis]GIJ05383.1 hypothetical protein Sya03_47350 [Spirilliplanes yamanashiensis]